MSCMKEIEGEDALLMLCWHTEHQWIENVYCYGYFIRQWFHLDQLLWRTYSSEVCEEITALLELKGWKEPFTWTCRNNSINCAIALLTVHVTQCKNSRCSYRCFSCEQRTALSLEIYPLASNIILVSANKWKNQYNTWSYGMTNCTRIILYFHKRRDADIGLKATFTRFAS